MLSRGDGVRWCFALVRGVEARQRALTAGQRGLGGGAVGFTGRLALVVAVAARSGGPMGAGEAWRLADGCGHFCCCVQRCGWDQGGGAC
ncbi:hypothetical protein ZWY2020_017097 [Hordeum vulgare]|nr:hypothetical protein ZWY2020_017097 [Hordeum vulgare]